MVLDEGHSYELKPFVEQGCESEQPQILNFMKRVAGKVVFGGTTNEEVFKMLINRMQYLQTKLPCRENAIVITKLEESLMWLESRTQKRIEQGVETKDVSHK